MVKDEGHPIVPLQIEDHHDAIENIIVNALRNQEKVRLINVF